MQSKIFEILKSKKLHHAAFNCIPKRNGDIENKFSSTAKKLVKVLEKKVIRKAARM